METERIVTFFLLSSWYICMEKLKKMRHYLHESVRLIRNGHFRLLTPCKRDLRSSAMLRSVDWLLTDVSGQPVSPIFKGQAVPRRTVTTNLCCLISQKSEDLISRTAELFIVTLDIAHF